MALFKILSNMTNPSKSMPNEYHQGYCYFDKNTGRFWIDTTDTKEGRLQINSSFFGECKKLLDSTTGQYTISQANSQVKKVDCDGFVLTPGASIFIKFTETNTYLVSDLSLNVNNTGARVIKYRNADTTRAWMKEGYTYCFVYDGDCYQLVGDLDTTYSGMSAAEGKTGTNTTNRVISAATLKAIIDARGYTTNTGTVTQVSTGVGLTGGPITNSGTIKVKLRSETALTRDSVAATETASRVYPVVQDKSGYLAVNVPWTDNDHNTTYTLVQDATDGHKLTFTPSSGQATVITIPDNNTTYSQAAYNYLGLVKPAYSSSNAVTLTTAASTNTNAPTIAARTTTTGRYYAVEVDKNGVPFVNVPWTDNDHNTTYTLTQDASDGHKLTFTPSGGTAVTITIPDNNTTYNAAKYNYLGLMKPAYSSTGAVTLTTTAASNSDTPTISARTTTAQRYYAIEVDKNGIPFVNVPWVDNNTWRGIQNNLTSSSTTDSLSAAMGKKLNDEKVAKAGDTMSGNLTVQKSTADDTGFLINNTNKTQSLGFIVGGSSGNAGLYSYTKSKWITYIDSSGNVQLNGNANTANKTSAANITTTQNAIAKYSNATGTFANSGVLIDNNNNLSVPGNITATGQLNLTGNAYLNNETYAEGITTNSLLVNGNTSFVQIPTAPTAAAGTSNTQLATTEFVTGAVQTVVGPMRFMGSLGGSGATITSLPTASSSNKGYTYKVIKDGTYGTITAKAGDTVISTGSDWVLIPSGDEPSGTVTSITLKAGGGITLDTDNTAITTSGTRTISHKDTSSVTNLAANGRTYVTGLTFDTYGHVTGYTTGTETVTDTDTHWTTHLYAGDGTAANKTTTNGNTKITVTDNSTVRNSITIKGSGTTSVTSDANGVITISSADSKTGTVTSITPGNGLLNGTTTDPITTSGTLNINYGTTTAKIGTTAAPGSATTVSRSDHVHAIDLATGDANGQVKIAGTNVSVKGLGSNAFNSTAYLPLAGGTMTGDITFSKPTTAGQKRGFVFSGVTDSAGLYYLEPNLNDDGRMRFIMKDNDSDPIEMAWTLYRASGKEIPGEHVVHSFNARGYTLSPIVEADGTKNPISIIPSINNFGSVGTSSNKWADMYATTFHGALDGNATTAGTATKLGSSTVGSNVKAIYLNNGTPTASDHEFAGGYQKNNANLNTLYDAGFYSSPGGGVTNYPANGDKYAAMLVVPYRKPSGNTTPDYAFQIGNFTQANDRLWYRTSNNTTWRGWRNIVNIAANTAVGGTTTPVYVDAHGTVTALSYTIAKSVPADAKFTDTTYTASDGITLSGTNFKINDNTLPRVKLMMTDTVNYAELNDYSCGRWGFTADSTADGHWYSMNTLARDKFISDYYQCNGKETFNIQFEISTTCKGNVNNGGTDSSFRGTAIGIYTWDEAGTSTGISYSTRVTADANGTVTIVNSDVTLAAAARKFRIFIQTESWGNFSGAIKIRKLKVIRVSAPKWYGDLSGNAATATKLATARTIQTNLASTSSVSFDGSANIEPGVKGTLGIANGGTGATTAANARTNLGLGTMATETAANYLKLSGGTMTGKITFNKVNNAIAYTGTQGTYDMIKFKDNPNDNYGNGIVIGGGGLTVIGGGESADAVAATYSSGGDEVLDLTSDGNVYVWTGVQSGVNNAKKFTFGSDGVLSGTQFSGNGSTLTNLNASNISSGTLSVAHGGTGATTFTSGAVLIGNGTGAIQTRGIRNNTSIGNLGWTSASTDTTLVTTNTIAYWNGAYQNTSSNLKYSANGEIMGLGSAQTVSGTKTFSAIQKFTNATDSTHSKDTAAAISTSGGISVEKQLSAKSIRIDNNQTSAGVQLIFDATLQALNFVFA